MENRSTVNGQISHVVAQQRATAKTHAAAINTVQGQVTGLQTQVTKLQGPQQTITLTSTGQITAPNGKGVFGWSGDNAYPLSTTGTDTNSGTAFVSGERAQMNALWSDPINQLVGLVNYIYAVLVDAGILAS